MIKKLLPIVLLLVGTGAGVGAGIFLRQPPTDHGTDIHAKVGEHDAEIGDHGSAGTQDAVETASNGHEEGADQNSKAYVKLSNQFVVPIVKGEKVAALVVMALSVEVPDGERDRIFEHEPKLRDTFLQVLFDHANIGGFDGAFTDANTMAVLRMALREVAQKDMGKEIVSDVLILDIARQDY